MNSRWTFAALRARCLRVAVVAVLCAFARCSARDGEAPRVVFFLHNRFLEAAGPDGVHPEYGRVEHEEVLQAFRRAGFEVHGERREPNTDLRVYAGHVARQVRERIAAGVPAANVTIVGTSQGGYLATLVAGFLGDPAIGYVLVGVCAGAEDERGAPTAIPGRVLWIDEATDVLTHGCQGGAGRAGVAELLLSTGLGHGFLYKASVEWIEPAIAWAKGSSDLCGEAPAPGPGAALARAVDAALAADTERPFEGVVLVARGTATILARCRGFADAQRSRPIVLSSAFGVGSISKQVTAVLALREAAKGRLRLDDRLGDRLPSVAGLPAGRATLLQLLTHTHGLVDRRSEPVFAPGTSFAYGNLGFDLMGECVEAVSGRSFRGLAEEEFRRLGMRSSRHPASPPGPTEVQGMWLEVDGTHRAALPPGTAAPNAASGGLVCSAPDLVAWTLALHEGTLLTPESRAALFTPHAQREHPAFGRSDYALGITTGSGRAGPRIGHTGQAPGFAACCFHLPDSRTTVVVLRTSLRESDDARRTYAPHVAVLEAVEAALSARADVAATSP